MTGFADKEKEGGMAVCQGDLFLGFPGQPQTKASLRGECPDGREEEVLALWIDGTAHPVGQIRLIYTPSGVLYGCTYFIGFQGGGFAPNPANKDTIKETRAEAIEAAIAWFRRVAGSSLNPPFVNARARLLRKWLDEGCPAYT